MNRKRTAPIIYRTIEKKRTLAQLCLRSILLLSRNRLLKVIITALVFFYLCGHSSNIGSSNIGIIHDTKAKSNNDINMVHFTNIVNDASIAQQKCDLSQSNISNIFLHVGPHKTGTTTFQNFFACKSSFLKEHDTYFLGKVNPRDVERCRDIPKDFVRNIVQYKNIEHTKWLKNEIEARVSLKQNIILSAEEFDQSDTHALVEILFRTMHEKLEYNVIPVVAYRWYHDWIKSAYYHYNKPRKHVTFWKTWDIAYEPTVRDKHLKSFQNETYPSIPTFRDYWKRFRKETHPSIQQINTFQELVARARSSANKPCVKVLNIHTDLVTEFLSIVKGYTGSSSSLISKVDNKASGKPFIVDSEILALKLKKDGLIHEKFSRRKTVTMLQKKMESLYDNATSINAPPLDCLSEPEEQEILSMTLQSDQVLLNLGLIDAPLVGQETLLQNFHKNIVDKVYCNVILEEMIKEKTWEHFIICLKNGTDCP